jgi:phosphatidylglycerophosphatase A
LNKQVPYSSAVNGFFPQLKLLLKQPVHFVAFGFGSGLSSKAPGTAGTLIAIPFYLLICKLPLLYYGAIVAAGLIIGVYVCDKTSKDLRVHDHSGIVWDEIIGYWITMMAIPPGWQSVIAGFVLFRLFDIWKPFPIRLLDKHVKGGFGVMIDDVVAAFFAWFCLYFWYFIHATHSAVTR